MGSIGTEERAGHAPYVIAKGRATFAAGSATVTVPVPQAVSGDLVFTTFTIVVDAGQWLTTAYIANGVLTISRGGVATNIAYVNYMVVRSQV